MEHTARKAAQTEIEANWDTATWSYVVMWFTTILTTMTFLVGCYVRYNDFTARWLKRNAKAATFPGKQFGLADVRLTIEALIDYAPVVEVVSASRLEEKKNQ